MDRGGVGATFLAHPLVEGSKQGGCLTRRRWGYSGDDAGLSKMSQQQLRSGYAMSASMARTSAVLQMTKEIGYRSLIQ